MDANDRKRKHSINDDSQTPEMKKQRVEEGTTNESTKNKILNVLLQTGVV
jgi:hypothetical protein